jgi:hypothetical protein
LDSGLRDLTFFGKLFLDADEGLGFEDECSELAPFLVLLIVVLVVVVVALFGTTRRANGLPFVGATVAAPTNATLDPHASFQGFEEVAGDVHVGPDFDVHVILALA